MNRTKLIKKIQGLLNLADPARGATPEEAAQAMAKATELMTRFRLSAADVEGKPHFDFNHEMVVTESEVPRDFDLNLSHVLISCFGIRVLFGRQAFSGRSYHALVLVGESLDIALAKIALPILASAMESCPSHYSLARARSFYLGVEHGYITASEQGRLRAEGIASRSAYSRYALVLVNKREAMTVYMDQTFGQKMKEEIPEAPVAADPEAWEKGFSAGSNLDLTGTKKLPEPFEQFKPAQPPDDAFEQFERELLRRMAQFDREMRDFT